MEIVKKICSTVSDVAFAVILVYILMWICGISPNTHKTKAKMTAEEHLIRIHIVDELEKRPYTGEELQYIIGDDEELREMVNKKQE